MNLCAPENNLLDTNIGHYLLYYIIMIMDPYDIKLITYDISIHWACRVVVEKFFSNIFILCCEYYTRDITQLNYLRFKFNILN